jgi:hypothetical protein
MRAKSKSTFTRMPFKRLASEVDESNTRESSVRLIIDILRTVHHFLMIIKCISQDAPPRKKKNACGEDFVDEEEDKEKSSSSIIKGICDNCKAKVYYGGTSSSTYGFICWECAVQQEMDNLDEDSFIAPETDEGLQATTHAEAVRRLAEEDASDDKEDTIVTPRYTRSSPHPSKVAPQAVAPLAPLAIDLTSAEEDDECIVEAHKWVGYVSLRYQSQLVKALSESVIREDEVDKCSCSEA